MNPSLLILIFIFLLIRPALALTPFSYQFYNSDGTAQTNAITMEAWPRSTNGWTVYGTNIIWGSQSITLAPGTNGYGTNAGAFPNTYRLWLSNLNSGFYISLPDNSTQQVSLGSCVVSAPQTAGPIGLFGMVTNWLGYMPATNNAAGIKWALGYTPATNSYVGLTNAAGFVFATNGIAAITNTLGYNPQNATFAALTNTLGFKPATNGIAAITNTLGYNPQNATFAALTNTMGYMPLATNVVLAESVLPQLGYIGVSNLNGSIATNRGTMTLTITTNLAIGTAPTMAAPDGSWLVASNGNFYVRSNATWVNLK